ncbi:hypothetical protein BH10BAC3_BH10BAC3_26370 [soil metagenome]
MKKLFCFFAVTFCLLVLQAQNIGIGTKTPNPTAILHIETGTTNKGLVITGAYNPAAVIPNFSEGGRMLFYPARAAFRAGYSNVVAWSNDNIGNLSIGLGTNTMAKGEYSTAFGANTIATGVVATAMGNSTIASGAVSTSMGEGSLAKGNYSTAMGYYSTAAGSYSTAMGFGSYAKGYSSTVVGLFNDSVLNNDQTQPPQGNNFPLFIVGNGSSNISRSNAMVVTSQGRVGIGANFPYAPLHVRSNSTVFDPQIWLEEYGNDFARLTFSNDVNANYWTVAALPQPTNPASLMNFYYKGFGDVLSLHGDGTAWLAGTLTQNSDARLKTNILPISSSLTNIIQLEGYQYKWKDENRDQDIQFGLLAQEVQKVFPELVKKDAKDVLGVNYNGFIPLLINSIKEQQYTIQALEKRLSAMEEKLK